LPWRYSSRIGFHDSSAQSPPQRVEFVIGRTRTAIAPLEKFLAESPPLTARRGSRVE
jgi:hypothetical protein